MRYTVPVAVLVLVATACAASGVRLGTAVDCDTTERGRLILVAQAVPTSTLIPCVEDLPPGWQIDAVETRTGEAVIVFENDTVDEDVTATLSANCPATGEIVASVDPNLKVLLDPPGTTRFLFTGGCLVFEFPPDVPVEAVSTLTDSVGYLTRDELRGLTGWTL